MDFCGLVGCASVLWTSVQRGSVTGYGWLGGGGCEEEFLWVVHDEAQTDKIGEEHACTVRWLSVRFQLLLVQLPTAPVPLPFICV